MSDLNNLSLLGRIVRDAMMKETSGGIKICEFSIASNHSLKNEADEYEEKTDFFPITIFGNYAEKMLPHLKKGRRVIIEGGIRQNKWTTGEGKTRSETVISVRKLHLIFDKKTSADEISDQTQEETADEESMSFTEDQLAELYAESPESLAGDALF